MESGCCSTPRCRRRAAGCRLSCSSGSPPPEGLSAVLPVTQLPGRRCRQGLWRRWPSRGRAANPASATSGRAHCSRVPRAQRRGAAARAFGSGAAGAGGPVQQPAVDRSGGHPRPGPAALHPAQTPVAIRRGPQRTAQPSGPASKVAVIAQLGCAGPGRTCGRKVGCCCSTSMRLAWQTAPRARRRTTDYSAIVRLVANPTSAGGCSTAGSLAVGELVGSGWLPATATTATTPPEPPLSSRLRPAVLGANLDRSHPRPRNRLRAPARRRRRGRQRRRSDDVQVPRPLPAVGRSVHDPPTQARRPPVATGREGCCCWVWG